MVLVCGLQSPCLTVAQKGRVTEDRRFGSAWRNSPKLFCAAERLTPSSRQSSTRGGIDLQQRTMISMGCRRKSTRKSRSTRRRTSGRAPRLTTPHPQGAEEHLGSAWSCRPTSCQPRLGHPESKHPQHPPNMGGAAAPYGLHSWWLCRLVTDWSPRRRGAAWRRELLLDAQRD